MMRVQCPHCGGELAEPALAISTFCRDCGEYFKVAPLRKKPRTLGIFGGRTVAPPVLQPAFERPIEAPPTTESQELAPPSMHRQIRCVDCGGLLIVSRYAQSTQCHHCSAYVSLEDVLVRGTSRANVRTRGNLTVPRGASLQASLIVCHHLRVFGKISGAIDCSGTALFRSSGRVVGSVHCEQLVVHKTSDLEFLPGVRAGVADIQGRVQGDLICDQLIRVSKSGTVTGNCTAPAVTLEDGGVLSGQMRFARPDAQIREDYARRAQAAREEVNW